MTFDLNEHLTDKIDGWCCPGIECADGFEMSVQASSYHYSTPRYSVGPWTHVEVGFPSERVEVLMPYAEDTSDPTCTVYPQVPIDIVKYVITSHGGVRQYEEKDK